MPPEKRQFAEGLINQFAVTSVTLERLADEINNGDLIEDFVQGAQKAPPGVPGSPCLQHDDKILFRSHKSARRVAPGERKEIGG